MSDERSEDNLGNTNEDAPDESVAQESLLSLRDDGVKRRWYAIHAHSGQ